MSAHTKGPWTIKYEFNIFGNGRVVASAGAYSSTNDSERVRLENVANAKLIAAAPELLAACEWLLSRVPTLAPDGKPQIDGIESARKAIAKARVEKV